MCNVNKQKNLHKKYFVQKYFHFYIDSLIWRGYNAPIIKRSKGAT